MNNCLPYVSVIVAARNEEDTLAACLKSLLTQSYPRKRYEIILVDDHSIDNTYSIACDFATENPILKVLKLDNAAECDLSCFSRSNSEIRNPKSEFQNPMGKQMALDAGIRACQGEIILSTDADCIVPNTWIENMVKAYEQEEGNTVIPILGTLLSRLRRDVPPADSAKSEDVIGVIAGFSMLSEEYPKDSKIVEKGGYHFLHLLFIKLQSLDLLSLFSAFAGGLKMGMVLACTGNNIGYRRQVYDELGGFANLGLTVAEDNMFIQWVDKHSKWRIKPICHPDATVLTHPMKTVKEFILQRLRWASNSTQNRISLVCFMVVVYVFYTLLPVALLLAAFGVLSWTTAVMILSLKLIPEFLLVSRGLKLFDRMDLLKYFPILEPCQIIYVLTCGIFGLLFKVVWKGRNYSFKPIIF